MNFQDESFWTQIADPNHHNYENLEKFLLHMALCHTIILDERTGRYNASSPDELALVNAAKFFGAEFLKRDEDNVMQINFLGERRQYRLMNILEFTSTRKRMSIIVEDLNSHDPVTGHHTIYVLTKGADSIIIPRLSREHSPYLTETEAFVDTYAQEGLRTLLLAMKKITENEYRQWNMLFEGAMQSVNNREEEVARVNDMMECNL